jgi:hypothetical protein
MIKNCVTIDVDEIKRGIYEYRANHRGEYPHYLIMNHRTFYEFRAIAFSPSYFINNEEGYLSYWYIPCAVCDKLKYGEVDFV